MSKIFLLSVFLFLMSFTAAKAQVRGYLKVNVIEGEGAFSDIKRKVSHPPVVEVRDESNNPILGAKVTFLLPAAGAGGAFAGGVTSYTTQTDAQGLARAAEYKPNTTEGRFNIKITASYEGMQGSVVISQSNTLAGGTSMAPRRGNGKKILLLTSLGGAAAGGVAVATGRGGSPKSAAAAPTPGTTLSAGAVTIGGPR